jgi:hypothetical protein
LQYLLITILFCCIYTAPIDETSISLVEPYYVLNNNDPANVGAVSHIVISANYDDSNDNRDDLVLAESQIFRPLFSYRSQNARRIRLKRSVF